MSKDGKQPKFSIGEKVLIFESGTETEVTKIYHIADEFYYQVKDGKNLYNEKNLVKVTAATKELFKRENVNINYKFRFGDIVRVRGYNRDLFVIIGFRAEVWRYKDSAWEDIIYECSRLSDGAWLEAYEDDLIYITNEENAKKLFFPKKDRQKSPVLLSPAKEKKRKSRMESIDSLLDMYNDYQYLYLNFGEPAYQKKMKEILKKLHALANNPFFKHNNEQ